MACVPIRVQGRRAVAKPSDLFTRELHLWVKTVQFGYVECSTSWVPVIGLKHRLETSHMHFLWCSTSSVGHGMRGEQEQAAHGRLISRSG